MTCEDCLSEMPCAFKLKEMYRDKAEKCPYFKNKADFVEVKHGEWKECGDLAPIDARCKCSLCGGYESNYYTFCHNCGAKMDGAKMSEMPTGSEKVTSDGLY